MCADRTFDLPFQKPGSSASDRRASKPVSNNPLRKEKIDLLCPRGKETLSLSNSRFQARLDSTRVVLTQPPTEERGRGILYAYDALASIFTSRIEDRRYDVVISFTCFSLLSALQSVSALFGCCCCLLYALRPTSGIGIVCNMHKCALRRVGFRPRGV